MQSRQVGRGQRTGGRVVPPQLRTSRSAGHDLAPSEEQDREQRARLRAIDGDRSVRVLDLQRPSGSGNAPVLAVVAGGLQRWARADSNGGQEMRTGIGENDQFEHR